MKKTIVVALSALVIGFSIVHTLAITRQQKELASLQANVSAIQGGQVLGATTTVGQMERAPKIRVFAAGNTCYVQQWFDGEWGTISDALLNGPNLCDALNQLGYTRAAVQSIDKTFPLTATIISQVGTSCTYYSPTSDGWTKGETTPLPAGQKFCSDGGTTTSIDSFLNSIPSQIARAKTIIADPNAYAKVLTEEISRYQQIQKDPQALDKKFTAETSRAPREPRLGDIMCMDIGGAANYSYWEGGKWHWNMAMSGFSCPQISGGNYFYYGTF